MPNAAPVEPTAIAIEFAGTVLAFTPAEIAAAKVRANALGLGQRQDGPHVEALLDAEQLAHLTSLPQSWLEEAARQERIPSINAGRYRRFQASAVIAALSNDAQGSRR